MARMQVEVETLRNQLHHAQRLATVGTMTAMLLHEFNNILTPIASYAQEARNNPTLTEKAIASAADGGRRATALCKAILRMTQEQPGEPTDANLRQTILDTLEVMGRPLHRDSIELVLDVPLALTLRTRKIELQQVLLNLIANARTAVLQKRRRRRIEISAGRTTAGPARPKDSEIQIRVTDNGVGIPPENLEKIFQPFFTTRSSSEEDCCGSGLGLAVCHEILRGMGGDVLVKSTVGQGTTFTVNLPAQPSAAECPAV